MVILVVDTHSAEGTSKLFVGLVTGSGTDLNVLLERPRVGEEGGAAAAPLHPFSSNISVARYLVRQ